MSIINENITLPANTKKDWEVIYSDYKLNELMDMKWRMLFRNPYYEEIVIDRVIQLIENPSKARKEGFSLSKEMKKHPRVRAILERIELENELPTTTKTRSKSL